MPANPSDEAPTPASIAASVKKYGAKAKMGGMHGMMMHGPMASVREEDYKGHHIVVRTTYQIEVDGRPLTAHIALSNEGQIAYHGLPNMNFDSAIALVEAVIDHFPEDFSPGGAPHHDMENMAGMGPKASSRPTKAAKKSSTASKAKANQSRTRKSK